MACVRLFSSKELPDGTKVMRLEVMGSPHLRPNDLLSLAAQQVTLTIHQNGRIQPEIHWRDESFPSFYPFLEWPSRKVATWHEVVSQANYVSDDAPARRWYAYDRYHQNILWENWFIGPSLNQGFRVIRHWITNTEIEGELNISYRLEYSKATSDIWATLVTKSSLDDPLLHNLMKRSRYEFPENSAESETLLNELFALIRG